MKRLALVLLVFFAFANTSKAQRLLRSAGYSLLTDLYSIPINVKTDLGKEVLTIMEPTPSYISVYFDLRYNLLEFDDDASLSLDVKPILSFPGVELNLPTINVITPIYLSYNKGAVATVNSLNIKGFGVSLGIDIQQPFISIENSLNWLIEENLPGRTVISVMPIIMPGGKLAYRAYSQGFGAAFEWFLSGAIGRVNSPSVLNEKQTIGRGMLGLKWYWNY